MADEKEEKVGTETPAPRPNPITILDYIPGWVPGVDALRKQKERIEKGSSGGKSTGTSKEP